MSKEKRLIRFDWAMKYMLKDPSNYYIAEGFLCALLNDNNITVKSILDSESNKTYPEDKFNRVDVLIEDGKGRNIIIEIQQAYESDYLHRILYGTSKHIALSIRSGDSYSKIAKVISVSIVYFNLGIGEDYLYHGKTHFIGKTNGEVIHQDSEITEKMNLVKDAKFNKIEIYPEYYLIQIDRYQDLVKETIDEWIYWFKNDNVKKGSSSKHIDEVEKNLNMLNMPKDEQDNYKKYLEKLASDKNILESAIEKGLKKGLRQGRKEGMEKGMEKGREEGMKEGERKKTLEIAKSLKIKGLSNEDITQITGLPEENFN